MSGMTFASKLNLLLKQKGWPQVRINTAFEQQVSPSTISKWVEGIGPLPRLDQVQQIAKLFDVPVSFLADDEITSLEGITAASSEEEELLKIARRLGFDLAFDRLLQREPVIRTARVLTPEESAARRKP